MGCGVIFDMDGVLVDSFGAHRESWRLVGAEIGRAVSDEAFAATFGRTSRDIIRILFGGDGDEAQVRRLDERKEALYRELIRGRVPVMPGALELMRRLHGAGMAVAIGSSGPPENVELVVDELDLSRWVSARVTGAEVTRGKPDPQVFLLAAERLGLAPGRCVVIEDAPVGIEAARRGGCAAIGLTGSHGRGALAAADLVVDRLDEIQPATVRRLVDGEAEPAGREAIVG